MAFTLSEHAKDLISQTNIESQLILEIDGLDYTFGAVPVQTTTKIGQSGLLIDGSWLIGGYSEKANSKDWIIPDKSTNRIQQQLSADKASVSSISTMKIALIDKDDNLTKDFSAGEVVADILSRPADIYLGLGTNSSHPEDSAKIYSGIIVGIHHGAGAIEVEVASPEQYKKQTIYTKFSTATTGSIDSSTDPVTFNVTTTTNFIPSDSSDGVTAYVRIDDEIMEVTSYTATSFTCTRAQLGSSKVGHDSGASVEHLHKLAGEPIDLALKTMLSDGGSTFASKSVLKFVNTENGIDVTNAIVFDDPDIQKTLGLVAGDKLTITGSTSNNVTNAVISSFGKTSINTSYIVTTSAMVLESDTTPTATFLSKYNVLSSDVGLGMSPLSVDVKRHEDYDTLIGGSMPSVELVIDDNITGQELINKQLYWSVGLYSLPRLGKVSVQATIPPISDLDTVILNEDNILNPNNLKVRRSINSKFYNAVQYRFAKHAVSGKYKAGVITISANSTDRIKIGNRVLKVDADGLLDDTATRNYLDINIARLLQKYQYGGESLTVITNYKTGYNLDVGDTVIADLANLKVSDTLNGTRDFAPKIMQIENKSLETKTGRVTLVLSDTIYSVDGRWGVFAPSSKTTGTPTTTNIPISKSYGTEAHENEKDKWTAYIGDKIQIRSSNFSYQETAILDGFSNVTGDMTISNLSGSAPSSGYIVEPAPYDDSGTMYKALNCFICPQVDIASGASSTVFDVDSSDISKFYVNGVIRVHNSDYSVDSGDVKIESISTNTITVKTDMGFTPSASLKVDLIGFSSDNGKPYLYL